MALQHIGLKSHTVLILINTFFFQVDCPDGELGKDKILDMYSMILPVGNARVFVDQIFRIFDKDGNGTIDFKVRTYQGQVGYGVSNSWIQNSIIFINRMNGFQRNCGILGISDKVENILNGSLDLIPSPSPSVKIQIQIRAGKFA